MNGATHVAIGLAAAHVAGANSPDMFGVAVLGSIWPDLDGGGLLSKPLENMLPKVLPRLGIVKVVDGTIELAAAGVRKVFGHRGLLHWPLLVGALLLYSCVWPGADLAGGGTQDLHFFCLGYLSHLYADALTKNGIPLAGPFYLDKVRLLPKWAAFRTGGLAETMLTWGLWSYLVALAARFVVG